MGKRKDIVCFYFPLICCSSKESADHVIHCFPPFRILLWPHSFGLCLCMFLLSMTSPQQKLLHHHLLLTFSGAFG
ncbi:hypothetical protein AQUCO_02000208v1 [Aquilegia coerulea]|uniref:Uncharacterized protein n=1 Tax=Aquilegia coerulea TaxID=218851 RepID=A0A2G5DGG1_AQUCA|nr:hypothetical protein AQUCO_02000208v1 [Aquilegia coerulea]